MVLLFLGLLACDAEALEKTTGGTTARVLRRVEGAVGIDQAEIMRADDAGRRGEGVEMWPEIWAERKNGRYLKKEYMKKSPSAHIQWTHPD